MMIRKMMSVAALAIAGALVPAMAAAEVSAASADCPRNRTVVAGDWLSKIAQKEYGSAREYVRIAQANNLSNPDLIRTGAVLRIPCKEDVQAAAEPAVPSLPVSYGLPAQYSGISLMAMPESAKALVPETAVPARDSIAPAPAVPAYAPADVSVTLYPDGTIESRSRLKTSTLQPGTYRITVSHDDLPGAAAGVYPALVLKGRDRKGRWRSEESVVSVVSAADGNWDVIAAVPVALPVSEETAVALDLGDRTINVIGSEELSQGLVIVRKTAPERKLSGDRYGLLRSSFPKKPGAARKIGRLLLTIGIPAVLGYETAGMWGLVSPLVTTFVQHKTEQAREHALEALSIAQQAKGEVR
jgi:LysM repeat protein